MVLENTKRGVDAVKCPRIFLSSRTFLIESKQLFPPNKDKSILWSANAKARGDLKTKLHEVNMRKMSRIESPLRPSLPACRDMCKWSLLFQEHCVLVEEFEDAAPAVSTSGPAPVSGGSDGPAGTAASAIHNVGSHGDRRPTCQVEKR